MDTFARMLALQEQLQRESFGYDFQKMTGEQAIQYIKDMKLALDAELQEALDETGWKAWATTRHINRDAYLAELVDVFHFFMNMLLVLGDSPDDLAAEVFSVYCRKNKINERRQSEGYDGVSTKCGNCGRALDDPAVMCKRWGDQGWCDQGGIEGVDVNYLTGAVRPEQKLSPIKPARDTVTP